MAERRRPATARARSDATSDDAIAQPRRAPVAAASVARTPLPGRLRLRVDVHATYAADVRRTVCQQQPQQHRRRARLSCVHRASSNGLRQLQHFPICLADVTASLSCEHCVTAIQRSSYNFFFTKYRPTEFVKRRYTQSARSASKMLTAIGRTLV